jgi:hypothetical protein
MKVLLVISFMLIGIIANAQELQINARIGDSPLKGVAGVELMYQDVGISAGWRPSKVWQYRFNSYCFAASYYRDIKTIPAYVSAGIATDGIIYYDDKDYKGTTSLIVLVGLQTPWPNTVKKSRVYFTWGAGGNFSQHRSMFAFEFLINFAIKQKNDG